MLSIFRARNAHPSTDALRQSIQGEQWKRGEESLAESPGQQRECEGRQSRMEQREYEGRQCRMEQRTVEGETWDEGWQQRRQMEWTEPPVEAEPRRDGGQPASTTIKAFPCGATEPRADSGVPAQLVPPVERIAGPGLGWSGWDPKK